MITDLEPYPVMKDSGVPWLAEVPDHWQVTRARYLFREVDQRSQTGAETHLSMSQKLGLVPSSEVEQRTLVSESYAGGKLCTSDDLVLNRLKAHLGVFARASQAGLVSPDYTVLRPRRQLNVRYFEETLRSPVCRSELRVRAKGIVEGFWRLYTDDFYDIRLPVPPLSEQVAIVRFLGYVDRRIRRYIRAKQKLIELLEEQKQAIIHYAVTRGLDPDVRLKPSGVEWLGDIPGHWSVRTLGQISTSFRTGPFGSILHQSDYVEGGTPVVNPTHMDRGGIFEDLRCSVPPPLVEQLSNYVLEKHDLVFARRGELGRCALVRDREKGWICGTGSMRVRVAYAGIEPEYLIEALQVRWVGEYLSLFSVGATMDSLNTRILKGVPILLPPAREQRTILERIARETARIRQVVSATEDQIALLREYRTRLIADVVTGKLDVREAAARLPDEAEEAEPLDEADALSEDDEELADDLDSALEEAGA